MVVRGGWSECRKVEAAKTDPAQKNRIHDSSHEEDGNEGDDGEDNSEGTVSKAVLVNHGGGSSLNKPPDLHC